MTFKVIFVSQPKHKLYQYPVMRSKSYCKVPINSGEENLNWVTVVVAISVGIVIGINFVVFAFV